MKGTHEYRKLITDINYDNDEEECQAKAVQLALQCSWSNWYNYIKNDLSWKTLISQPQNLSSFCINSTYNTLPSPSNLFPWGLEGNNRCSLCKLKPCTTAHIFSACKVALQQGRYTYRHDSVLCELLKILKKFLISLVPIKNDNVRSIKFVRPGYSGKPSKKSVIGLLHLAGDWQVLSDLDSSLAVPSFLAISQLRPDIFIFSRAKKTAIMLELTCPCEENMENWHSQKTDKYGYASESVRFCLRQLGFPKKLSRRTLKLLSSMALRSSFYIW